MHLMGTLDRFLSNRRTFGIFEDWLDGFVSGDRWTPLTADSSSAATLVLALTTTGANKGILSVTQDATDNDEIYFGMTCSPFLFAANKPCFFEARQYSAELATSTNNVIAGFCSTYGANTLIDNGGGPVASGTMALWYKVDGGTAWRVRSQIGAAVGQTDTITNITSTETDYHTLGVEVLPLTSTLAEVRYYYDGAIARDTNNYPICHQLTYTNAVVVSPIIGTKTGGAQAQVLLNDYVAAYQER